MAYLSIDGWHKILSTHMCEIVFNRRHEKLGYPMHRRLLGTNCRQFMTGLPFKLAFHFNPPRNVPFYNRQIRGLVCVFDILWQDFRTFGIENAYLVNALPVYSLKDQKEFWKWFNGDVVKWSAAYKESFMQK